MQSLYIPVEQIQHTSEAYLPRTHCAADMASSVCGGRREEEKNVRKKETGNGGKECLALN